jgi:hypothetical protein
MWLVSPAPNATLDIFETQLVSALLVPLTSIPWTTCDAKCVKLELPAAVTSLGPILKSFQLVSITQPIAKEPVGLRAGV